MPNDKGKGRLIIISGPSGVGKGTICKKLVEKNNNLAISVSATTRKPGLNEVQGLDYLFCTKDEFQRIIDQDGFLEWAEVHGNCYGTMKEKVRQILETGKDCILEIDVQGGLQVLKKLPSNCLTIFIKPPSEEELLRRILCRKRDNQESIDSRMKTAQWEMAQEEKYQFTVVNDDLEAAVDKILLFLSEEDA